MLNTPGLVTIYAVNMSEDVWPFIQTMSGAQEQRVEIEENANLSDRDLFSIPWAEEIIFLSPRQLSPAFLQAYKKLFGDRPITVLTPSTSSGLISSDFIADGKVVKQLLDIVAGRRAQLLCYSTSPQFLELAEFLRHQGLQAETPHSPDLGHSWTVNFYGSKTGIRQLADHQHAQNVDTFMSEGLITFTTDNAARAAAARYLENGDVVIKTHKGHAGEGVLLIRPGELPNDFIGAAAEIQKMLDKNAYWAAFPIIVEDMIDVDETYAGGFPSAEFQVLPDGSVQFLYSCAMRMTHDGVFQGIAIHDHVLPEKLDTIMKDVGMRVAQQYAKDGYRGYFDIDFAIGKDGKVYITESNVRRTGGTHVYETAKQLLGPNFLKEAFVLSHNTQVLPEASTVTDFEQLQARLASLAYNPETKEGIVLCSENLLAQRKFSFIVFGHDQARAEKLEHDMLELLAH